MSRSRRCQEPPVVTFERPWEDVAPDWLAPSDESVPVVELPVVELPVVESVEVDPFVVDDVVDCCDEADVDAADVVPELLKAAT